MRRSAMMEESFSLVNNKAPPSTPPDPFKTENKKGASRDAAKVAGSTSETWENPTETSRPKSPLRVWDKSVAVGSPIEVSFSVSDMGNPFFIIYRPAKKPGLLGAPFSSRKPPADL